MSDDPERLAEPLWEPLSEAEFHRIRNTYGTWVASHIASRDATIDALLSQLREQRERADKLADERNTERGGGPVTNALFDADALDEHNVGRVKVPGCGDRGPDTSWLRPNRLSTARPTRPRCNRPAGHEGNHVRYGWDGSVAAQWRNKP